MVPPRGPDFAATVADAYAVEGPAVDLGRGVHSGELVPEAVVGVPLAMTRHGLIAGATGTGKTVTLQVLTEQLSAAGVPAQLGNRVQHALRVHAAGREGAESGRLDVSELGLRKSLQARSCAGSSGSCEGPRRGGTCPARAF